MDSLDQCIPRINPWLRALLSLYRMRFVVAPCTLFYEDFTHILQSDITKVKPENLVVFTVRYK